MAKAIRLAGDIFLFLAGLVAGILTAIYGLAPAIGGEEVSAIYHFHMWVYPTVVVVLAAGAASLRSVAKRVV